MKFEYDTECSTRSHHKFSLMCLQEPLLVLNLRIGMLQGKMVLHQEKCWENIRFFISTPFTLTPPYNMCKHNLFFKKKSCPVFVEQQHVFIILDMKYASEPSVSVQNHAATTFYLSAQNSMKQKTATSSVLRLPNKQRTDIMLRTCITGRKHKAKSILLIMKNACSFPTKYECKTVPQ